MKAESLPQFFKNISKLIKVSAPLLKREGIEAKTLNVKHDGKTWKAILLREIKKK
jgi:hypothetical protein